MEVSRIAVARLSQGLGVANMEFGLKQMQWCRADTWHNMAQLPFGWGDLPLEPFTFLISLARAQSSACNMPGKGMKREHMNTYGAFCRTLCLGENIVARNALGNRGGQGVFQLQLQSKRCSLTLEAEEKMQKLYHDVRCMTMSQIDLFPCSEQRI